MPSDAIITILVILLVLALLVRGRYGSDIIIAAGVALLMVLGVMTPRESIAGLANEGVVTIAVLYVVIAGLSETGAVRMLGSWMMGRAKSPVKALTRMVVPISALSGFVNNTPLVAMFIPAVSDWCKRNQVSPSRMLIPLSYAAIMGGTMTLIGTSTNLVVYGAWKDVFPDRTIGMFDIAWVGFPSLVVGLVYLLTIGRLLLPDRAPVLSVGDDARSYHVEMLVEPSGPMVGKTIEQAGLRGLPGLYLSDIERDGHVLAAVAPDQMLLANDRLLFVGVLDSIVDLNKFRGLQAGTNQVQKLAESKHQRHLVEAVVSDSCPLIGRNVREFGFRSKYNAVVIAVARNGEQIKRKIGDIIFRTGDTLLLEAPQTFVETQRNSRDFLLVSAVEDSQPILHEKAWISIGIVLAMVLAVTFGSAYGITMLHAAVVAAGLMLATRCCSGASARRSINWQLLVVIAGSLGLGKAMQVSDADDLIATNLISIAGNNPYIVLALLYLSTMLLTEIITNSAAAILNFSLAMALAQTLGLDPKPLAMAVMMAASASFSSPIGYQTNLMVMAPGGYRFTDYLRVGMPLNLLFFVVSVIVIPMHWPLRLANPSTP
ncbi:MAG: SLC13 family permease [Phycisphaeraceae bacterium]|nr:SLC13 family permease [Phycisphaerales bacterium]MCB9859372.1 SLC13 family permease [Phycisphaeraceae bacterium]